MLPLPNLDARRWSDLIDEGRALIPRHSRLWTDHNLHDPGITFMELFAAWAERGLYAANRIPRRHVLKYLELAGFTPRAARPAHVVIAFEVTAGTPPTKIPAGLLLDASVSGLATTWRLTTDLTAVRNTIVALQSFDGREFAHLPLPSDESPVFGFGSNPTADAPPPAEGPSLAIGFSDPLVAGQEVTLYFQVAGEAEDDREALNIAATLDRERCGSNAVPCPPRSPAPDPCCPEDDDPIDLLADSCGPHASPPRAPSAPGASQPLRHHDVDVVWEIRANGTWRTLGADEVSDDTRALTLSGPVVLKPQTSTTPEAVGEVPDLYHYVRCRLARGRWDAAPRIAGVLLNGASVMQVAPLLETLPIDPTTPIPGGFATGPGQRLLPSLDERGNLTGLAVAPAGVNAPALDVVEFVAPTSGAPGKITFSACALRTEPGTHGLILSGDGLPEQIGYCPPSPLAQLDLAVWVLGGASWEAWELRADLDAASGTTAAIATDSMLAEFGFGDGARGRVLPSGATAWLQGWATKGLHGVIPANAAWAIRVDGWNRTLLASDPAIFATAFADTRNPSRSIGGHAPESLDDALHRALDSMWVHDRLLDAAGEAHGDTIDPLDPGTVRALPVPERATTGVDYERLALAIPGTAVRRARAWVDLDVRYDGLVVPGVVTVIVVPSLPEGRPAPSSGLLRAIRNSVEPRRTICTKVVVTGPEYLEIAVRSSLKLEDGSDAAQVLSAARAALDRFLDPLTGGPYGRGWPFGRDVYRSEILDVLDEVPGVEHVVELALMANGCTLICSNACVPPTALVTPGAHTLESAP